MHQIDQIEVQKKYKYKEESESDSGSEFQIMTTEYYHEYDSIKKTDCVDNDWGLFVEIDLPSISTSVKCKKTGKYKLYLEHLSSIEEEDENTITDDDKKTIKENLEKGEIAQLYLGILICSLTIYLIHFCVVMG